MNKKKWKRVLAVLMSIVMVVTGIKLANSKTYAADYHTTQRPGDTIETITDSYYDLPEYDPNDIFGAAQRFVLFGRESATIATHTNGNVASPKVTMGTGSMEGAFTVNGFNDHNVPYGPYRLINYVGEVELYGQLGINGNGHLLVVGQNGNYVSKEKNSINGGWLNGNFANVLYENPEKPFLDFDKEFAHLERLSHLLSTFTGDTLKKVQDVQRVDGTQTRYLEVGDGVTVLSLTGAELANNIEKDFHFRNIQYTNVDYNGTSHRVVSGDQVLIVNVDLNGYSEYEMIHDIKYTFTDGQLVESSESTIYNGTNIIWNFYDSGETDKLYKGKLHTSGYTMGVLLAPAANIQAHASNGSVIGKTVASIGGECHRSDFIPKAISGLGMYKLTYDKNAPDATGTAVTDTNLYEYNKPATIKENTWTRNNHRFLGWSENAKDTTPTYKPGDTIYMDTDKTLYAIWAPTVKVTYDKNLEDATGSQKDDNSPYLKGDKVTVLDQGSMSATGYVFKGWNPKKAEATAGTVDPAYAVGSEFTIDKDTTLFAVWEKLPTYYVQYHPVVELSSGYAPIDVNSPYYSGSKVTVLDGDSMSASGLEFVGWNTDKQQAIVGTADPAYAPDATFIIKADTDLYAAWRLLPTYKVTYHPNATLTSGEEPVDNTSYPKGSTVQVLDENNMYVEDKMFIGWNTDAEAAKAGKVTYAVGQTFKIQQDTDLYAVWADEVKCHVVYHPTLELDEGEAPVDGTSYKSGSTVTVLDQGTMKVENYYFVCWTLVEEMAQDLWIDPDSPELYYYPGDTFTIEEDTHLYAIWAEGVNVTYHKVLEAASDAPVDENNPYDVGSEVIIKDAGTMKAEGYDFIGWARTEADALAGVPDSGSAPGTHFAIETDTDFYAVWIPKLKVTYHENITLTSGKAPTDSNNPYSKESKVIVLDAGTMKAEGYEFVGWNRDEAKAKKGEKDPNFDPDKVFIIMQDTDLYAAWRKLPTFTVTYHENITLTEGEAPVDANAYVEKSTVTVLDAGTMVATGYVFKGWNPDATQAANGTVDANYAPNGTFSIKKNTDLYAVWEKLPTYTVTYHEIIVLTSGAAPVDPRGHLKDESVTVLSQGTMEADNYVFKGWNMNETAAKNGVVQYKKDETFKIQGNTDFYAVWIPLYTVEYDANIDLTQGEVPTDSTQYESGATVTVLDEGTMEATDYTFLGWSEDEDATTPDEKYAPGSTFTISKNVKLYGVWQAIPTYTVTYDKNLAAASAAPTDSNNPYKTGETVTVLGAGTMKADGYVFKGWSLEKEPAQAGTADASYAPGKTFEIKGNVTLYAAWVPVYTVTYDKNLDAASAAPKDTNSPYEDGATVTVLGAGTMKADGYVFKGWNTEKEPAQAGTVDEDYAPGETFEIKGNVTLYAAWAPVYTVEYDANIELTQGEAPTDSTQYESGQTVTVLGEGTMEATDYIFLGWSTDKNATTPDEAYAPNATFTISDNVKLYGVWQAVPTYTVTYDKNLAAASAAPTDSQSPYKTGSTVTVLGAGTMKADGYVFKGWSLEKEVAEAGTADASYAPGKTFEIKGNVTLYAAWAPVYTVEYDANIKLAQGEAPTDSTQYESGQTVTVLGEGTMEATDYIFLGWSTDKNATTPDEKYAPDATFAISDNVKLYGVWQAVPTYTVTYDKNLSTASAAPTDSQSPYKTGSTVTVLGAGEMKADGYVFVGWSRDANETSPDENLAPGKTFTITQDEVFYAVWLPTFTVTYVANIELTKGAAPTDTNEYKEGEFATAKTQGTMEATGYTFLGWSEDKNATTADYNYDPDAEFQVLKDTTLYAVWEKIPTYTITYVKNLDAASAAPVDSYNPYTTGSTVTILDQGEMKADGYQFMGWKPDLGSTGANPDCAPGKTFTINQDVTLYAVWVPTHTLTYDANGGENAPVDGKNPYLDGAFVIIAEQGGMTKGTDAFKGWSKDQNATEADDAFIPGSDYQLTEDTTLYAVWASTYAVNFDANGGANGPSDDKRYEAGESVKIPDGTPEKKGARFDGWTLDPNDSDAPLYQPGDDVLVTGGDITLTAVWTDVYSVVYDPNGGADEPKDERKYENGEQAEVPSSIPTKEGFEFKGWSLDPNDAEATLYKAGDTVTVEGKDITFTAIWSKINDQPIVIYKVAYDPAGGVPTPADTTEYVDGATVIITSDIPVRDSFTFGGWTQDPEDPAAPVLKGGNTTTIQGSDITFTAIWIPNYVVIYDKNAEDATGSQKDTNNPYESGETVTVLGAGTIAREDYIFKGWTKDPAVDVVSFVEGDTFAIAEDTKFYAVWEAIPTYKVVYDPNGGSNEPTDATQYKNGETVTVSDVEPVKSGFIFEGWTLDPSAATPELLKGGQTTTVNGGDVTLTAVWKVDSSVPIVVIYKVTYDPQGGTPTPVDATEYVDGGTVIVTSDVPVKDGFALDGWTLDPNAATPVILTEGQTTTISGSDLTLYAVWAPVYTVDYDADGAASTPKDEKKYRNGEKAVIMKDIPKKDGANFKGWTLDPNDTTNLLQNGDTVTVDGKNIVLYAVFEDITSITYTVKYDLNGGEGTAPSDANAYAPDSSVTIVNDVPKRSGYTFTGWATKVDGTTLYKGGDSFTITSNITFYAQWTANGSAMKTGDPMSMLPWMLMALLSMAGASVAVIRGKKKER